MLAKDEPVSVYLFIYLFVFFFFSFNTSFFHTNFSYTLFSVDREGVLLYVGSICAAGFGSMAFEALRHFKNRVAFLFHL